MEYHAKVVTECVWGKQTESLVQDSTSTKKTVNKIKNNNTQDQNVKSQKVSTTKVLNYRPHQLY